MALFVVVALNTECLSQSDTRAVAPAEGDPAAVIRPQGSLVRPVGSFSNADLDKAWGTYEANISAAAARVHEALIEARQAARERGDLEAAKVVRTAIEAFEEKGEWPTLRDIEKITADARSGCKQAMSDLGQAYIDVVQALTKDTKLDEAVAENVEAERQELFIKGAGSVRGGRRPQHDDPSASKSGRSLPETPPVYSFIDWKTGGAADTRLIHKSEGFCFLAGVEGNFEGAGESAMLSVEADGFWHLRANSHQPGLRVRIGVVRLTSPTSHGVANAGVPKQPKSQDRLGRRMVYREEVWAGVWIRRGASNVWDCRMVHPAGEIMTHTCTVIVDGNRVTTEWSEVVSSLTGPVVSHIRKGTLSEDGQAILFGEGGTFGRTRPGPDYFARRDE